MQLCRINLLFPCSLAALHVSSDIAHHQEHLNRSYSFWFFSHVSLSAAFMAEFLHVSRNIIAHHQKYLNCSYSFWFYSHLSLLAAFMAEYLAMKAADKDTCE